MKDPIVVVKDVIKEYIMREITKPALGYFCIQIKYICNLFVNKRIKNQKKSLDK